MIQFQTLTPAQVGDLYSRYMEGDFPSPELKPLSSILGMMERRIYLPLSVLEEDQPVGYALLLDPPGETYLLLDYLATFPTCRGKGLGARILSALEAYLAPRVVLLESEYPPAAPDPALAARRLAFYQRSGCRLAPVRSRIFGVEYSLLALSRDPAHLEQVGPAMEGFYRLMVRSQSVRDRQVQVFLPES